MITVDELAAVIERAARDSVPYPKRRHYPDGSESDWDNLQPQTLEQFVGQTYLGADGPHFPIAAMAAAKAVYALLQ